MIKNMPGMCCNRPKTENEEQKQDMSILNTTNSLLLQRQLALQRQQPAIAAKSLLTSFQQRIASPVIRATSSLPFVAPVKYVASPSPAPLPLPLVKPAPLPKLPAPLPLVKYFPQLPTAVQPIAVAPTTTAAAAAATNTKLAEMLKTEQGTIPVALLPPGVKAAGIAPNLPSVPVGVWGIAAVIGAFMLFSGKKESKEKGLSGIRSLPSVRTKRKNTKSSTKGKAAKISGREIQVISL